MLQVKFVIIKRNYDNNLRYYAITVSKARRRIFEGRKEGRKEDCKALKVLNDSISPRERICAWLGPSFPWLLIFEGRREPSKRTKSLKTRRRVKTMTTRDRIGRIEGKKTRGKRRGIWPCSSSQPSVYTPEGCLPGLRAPLMQCQPAGLSKCFSPAENRTSLGSFGSYGGDNYGGNARGGATGETKCFAGLHRGRGSSCVPVDR